MGVAYLGKPVEPEVLKGMSLEDKIIGGYYKTEKKTESSEGKQKKRNAIIRELIEVL